MYERKLLGLKEAQEAIEVMIQEVKTGEGYWRYGCFAVVDYRGDLIAFARMDGTGKHGLDMAFRKAYSAAMWGNTTSGLQEYEKEHPYGVSAFGPDYTVVAGGVPIIPPGSPEVVYMAPYVIGAIGVANAGRGKQDEAIALVGLKYIQSVLWPSK